LRAAKVAQDSGEGLWMRLLDTDRGGRQDNLEVLADAEPGHQIRQQIPRIRPGDAAPIDRCKRPPDADYVILADPEGNRFWVVDIGQSQVAEQVNVGAVKVPL
jgi:hypothetical protein